MYRWRLIITLNSGKEIVTYYKGPETNSDAVSRKLFNGGLNTFIGLSDSNGRENIFIRLGEIAAVVISIM